MRIILLTMCLIISFSGRSQVNKGFELSELLKITQAYQQVDDLSFSMTYEYADSAAPASILETMVGSAAISRGRCWTMLDSIEFVQGYQYGLAVYHKEEIIVVSDRQQNANLLQLPVLDSIFQTIHVDSMNVAQLDDTTRELVIYFGDTGPYELYKARYDSRSYLVSTIQYYIQDMPSEAGAVTSGTALVKLTISGYSFAPVDLTLFQEGRFISSSGGEIIPEGDFEDFRLFNNTTTKPVKLYEK